MYFITAIPLPKLEVTMTNISKTISPELNDAITLLRKTYFYRPAENGSASLTHVVCRTKADALGFLATHGVAKVLEWADKAYEVELAQYAVWGEMLMHLIPDPLKRHVTLDEFESGSPAYKYLKELVESEENEETTEDQDALDDDFTVRFDRSEVISEFEYSGTKLFELDKLKDALNRAM
jgi:hypothetical protein